MVDADRSRFTDILSEEDFDETHASRFELDTSLTVQWDDWGITVRSLLLYCIWE